MESVFLSCIFGTINGELQDIAKEHYVITHQVWLTLEHQFIGNSEMCTHFILTPRSTTSYKATSR
jgi:hypothetical protein